MSPSKERRKRERAKRFAAANSPDLVAIPALPAASGAVGIRVQYAQGVILTNVKSVGSDIGLSVDGASSLTMNNFQAASGRYGVHRETSHTYPEGHMKINLSGEAQIQGGEAGVSVAHNSNTEINQGERSKITGGRFGVEERDPFSQFRTLFPPEAPPEFVAEAFEIRGTQEEEIRGKLTKTKLWHWLAEHTLEAATLGFTAASFLYTLSNAVPR